MVRPGSMDWWRHIPSRCGLNDALRISPYSSSTGGAVLDKLNKFGMLSAFVIGACAVGFLMGGRSLERYDPARQALEFEVADQSEQIEKLKISNFMLEPSPNQLQGTTEIDAGAATAAPAPGEP
jgi:hypothetical protein